MIDNLGGDQWLKCRSIWLNSQSGHTLHIWIYQWFNLYHCTFINLSIAQYINISHFTYEYINGSMWLNSVHGHYIYFAGYIDEWPSILIIGLNAFKLAHDFLHQHPPHTQLSSVSSTSSAAYLTKR